ncbi:hypothetical protein [Streptomyces vinaceus]|uniref:hypothetical protein n=1 Tax=Streptomyces vinaceus TaxID=1960 RepID=UPI0038045BEC
MNSDDAFGQERHPWIGRPVQDIPAKATGRLITVVHERVRDHEGKESGVLLAYILSDSGIAWSTAVGNIALLP